MNLKWIKKRGRRRKKKGNGINRVRWWVNCCGGHQPASHPKLPSLCLVFLFPSLHVWGQPCTSTASSISFNFLHAYVMIQGAWWFHGRRKTGQWCQPLNIHNRPSKRVPDARVSGGGAQAWVAWPRSDPRQVTVLYFLSNVNWEPTELILSRRQTERNPRRLGFYSHRSLHPDPSTH